MKLSVIVPVYNVEEYIVQCINSIYAQSYKDYEVIFVDDGSTDNSVQIVEDFIKSKSINNFRVVHKNNEGLPQARKTGLKYATGEYISFIDSDDWIDEDYFNNCMKYVGSTGLDFYNLGYYEDKCDGKPIKKANVDSFRIISNDEYISLLHKRQLFHSMWSKIIKKDLLDNIFLFPKGNFVFEDYVTLIPSISNIESIGLVPECGYHYRIRNISMAHGGFNEYKRTGFNYLNNLYPVTESHFKTCLNEINTFYCIEYMAIIISMGRNHNYEKNVLEFIRRFLLKNIKIIMSADYVDGIYKISVIPLLLFPRIFSTLYIKLFK